jgi:hypothetical protein
LRLKLRHCEGLRLALRHLAKRALRLLRQAILSPADFAATIAAANGDVPAAGVAMAASAAAAATTRHYEPTNLPLLLPLLLLVLKLMVLLLVQMLLHQFHH